jgi:hypothetical protein
LILGYLASSIPYLWVAPSTCGIKNASANVTSSPKQYLPFVFSKIVYIVSIPLVAENLAS